MMRDPYKPGWSGGMLPTQWRPEDSPPPSHETDPPLLDGEANIGGKTVMTGREWASEVLSHVAEQAWTGSPIGVSGFDLGRALSRACINNNETDNMDTLLTEITRGWKHVDTNRKGK